MIYDKENKLMPEELRVEKIGKAHLGVISSFQSYEKELVDFIIEDASSQQKQGISVTYLWFTRAKNELVGYITLCPDSVKTHNLREDLCDKIKQKGIPYKALPCLKIGRLCVDNRFQKRGVGRLMIYFAIEKALKMNSEVGCRFLYLDAKRNYDKQKDAIHFYLKFNFQFYKNKDESKTTPLYLDLIPFIKESTN